MVLRLTLLCALCALAGCAPSEEAPTLEQTLIVDGMAPRLVRTDLGYTVTVTRARSVMRDLRVLRGEVVASAGWLIGSAHAHPGHGVDGQVVGELPGRVIIEWTRPGQRLGAATLLPGRVDAMEAVLALGAPSDGLAPDDPLIGHTFAMVGVASKDGVDVPFTARIVAQDGLQVAGIPAAEGDAPDHLGVRLSLKSLFTHATVFDGIDFAHADFSPGGADHNRLLLALRGHDHYLLTR